MCLNRQNWTVKACHKRKEKKKKKNSNNSENPTENGKRVKVIYIIYMAARLKCSGTVLSHASECVYLIIHFWMCVYFSYYSCVCCVCKVNSGCTRAELFCAGSRSHSSAVPAFTVHSLLLARKHVPLSSPNMVPWLHQSSSSSRVLPHWHAVMITCAVGNLCPLGSSSEGWGQEMEMKTKTKQWRASISIWRSGTAKI